MPETRPETMREDLTAAIAGCAAPGPLLERATSLFGVLGYHSERTGEAHSAAEFLQEYDGHDPRLSDRQRKLLLDAWDTVGIVFQFTDEEIGVIQASLFKDQGFEPGRIKSFLFLAVELVGGDYDRTRLAEMTRAVNRIFSMPVVVLFRHGGDDAYLLALLNSKVLDLYFRLAMPCLDDPFDGGDMEFRGAFMERVPIAPANAATKKRLSHLAEKIQTAKETDPKADTEALEQEINEIVYGLYGITKKERKLIDGWK